MLAAKIRKLAGWPQQLHSSLLAELKKVIDPELGRNVTILEAYADPGVKYTYAVRVKDGNQFDLLVEKLNSKMPLVEEVDFKQWPPKSRM